MQLDLEGVSKQYGGKVWGLRAFTMTLRPGVLGLLGPNGAGKSTLMRILATVTRSTGGRVLWNGTDISADPDSVRAVLGYLPQDFGVYPISPRIEFLEYLAAVKGLDACRRTRRIEELLEPGEPQRRAPSPARRLLGRHAPARRHRAGAAQRSRNSSSWMSPPPGSTPRSACASATCSPSFPASAS